MFETLIFPLYLPFLQKAFAASIMVAIPMALLSCFLVLRGWALMGDSLTHAVLPGIVLAYVLGLPLVLGAFFAGFLCSGLIGYIDDHSQIKRDTVMGVVFSAMFAAGLVLFVAIPSDLHLNHILFGSILGIQSQDLWQIALISIPIIVVTVIWQKDILLCSFDSVQAKICGIRVRVWHYALLVMITLVIVATLQVAGIIMALGLLIAPGAISFLLCQRLCPMMIMAVIVSIVCCFLGVYLSFFWDSAPAPTIMVLLAVSFLFAFVWRSLGLSSSPDKFSEGKKTHV